MPGLRIGWLASHDLETLTRVSLLKDYTTICSSAPSEILAIIALRNRDAIIAQQLARVRRNLTILDDFFTKYHDLFICNQPAGGSICFPRMLTVKDTYEFCEQLVADTGIMLVPSRIFQFGDQHVRIGFGRENFPEVLNHFSNYLDQQYH
jgi:aspartate/methionine/tyrosine aminotransferase